MPSYSFLEPESSSNGNSQHPNYDVALGEQLIHDVYYALQEGRTSNQTLLIITYDEHGGNFDHVPPAAGRDAPTVRSTLPASISSASASACRRFWCRR